MCATLNVTARALNLNRVRYRAEHEKIKFISKSGHVTYCLLYKHQWKRCELLCNHNDGNLFMCEDNMLFSLVKKFSRKSSLGISLVFIINKYISRFSESHSFSNQKLLDSQPHYGFHAWKYITFLLMIQCWLADLAPQAAEANWGRPGTM